MSLDKAIKHGKEFRKEYRGSKVFDRSCRHGGSCSYCENNRRHIEYTIKEKADQAIKEYKNSDDE